MEEKSKVESNQEFPKWTQKNSGENQENGREKKKSKK